MELQIPGSARLRQGAHSQLAECAFLRDRMCISNRKEGLVSVTGVTFQDLRMIVNTKVVKQNRVDCRKTPISLKTPRSSPGSERSQELLKGQDASVLRGQGGPMGQIGIDGYDNEPVQREIPKLKMVKHIRRVLFELVVSR
jgi:hypothetical protein